MALSTNTMRGLIRYLPGAGGGSGKGAAVSRLVVYPETTTPVYGSHIRPTSAPSGTGAAGDFYMVTDGTLYTHNGTAFMAAPSGLLAPKTAAATLTAADSGKTCFFTTAAGYTYTLPTPVAGMRFKFVITTTITSVAAKVITDSASVFLTGVYTQSTDGTYTTAQHVANGSTIRAISMNGTTTGGYAGDWWEVVATSATNWMIWGFGRATGSEATPFATS